MTGSDGERSEGSLPEVEGGVAPGSLSALLVELARLPPADLGAAWGSWLRPGAVIGRFELVREIGRGGLGVVYEARDRELGRSVAFKAVRAGGTVALREERLLREAEASARLSHPNIATLHDVGRTEHGPYLVLELLRGQTLEERLGQGRVPVREALHIGVEVARGVAHAHAQGVVHRDLKPSNVFLCEDGQVKVLDFGLAHAFGQRRAEGGTPSCMAPEQWKGAPEDERTDVFALGVMLHRMLAGEPPFPEDDGGKAVRSSRRAPALEVPEVPALGELVGAMLEKDPTRRPRDGGAVLARLVAFEKELERSAPAFSPVARARRRSSLRVAALVAAGAALGLTAAAVALRWRKPAAPELQGRVTVAVADFANETRDPDLDGLSGLLIISLEQSKKLRVMTRGRMIDLLRQAGKSDAPRIDESLARDAGKRAGVRALLVASIRTLGETYAAELRAIDPERDEYLFTLREQAASKAELLALVDRLSDQVRARLQENDAEVKASEVNVAEAVTPSLEAYRHYFLGKELAGRLDFPAARGEFTRAVEIEPRFALAHFEIAFLGVLSGSRDRRDIGEAMRSGDRAPEKERGLIRALDDFLAGRFASAQARLRAVEARFPDDADVALAVGELLGLSGDVEGMAEALERTLRIRPEQHFFRMELVGVLEMLGRGAEALRVAEEASQRMPGPEARTPLALARAQLGDLDGALADLRGAGKTDDFATWLMAQILAATGRRAEADAVLAGREDRLFHLGAQAVAAAYQGRLRAGRAFMEAGGRSPGADAAQYRMIRAWYLAAAGRGEEALRLAGGAFLIPNYDLVLYYEAGDDQRVRSLLEALPPDGMCARLFRALQAHRAGRIEEALAALRTLDRHAGWYVPFYRGVVAAQAGHDQEAVEALQRFAPILFTSDSLIHPWLHARARILLARSLERLGRRDAARQVLDRQLALWKDADPDLPLLAEAKALKKRLAGDSAAPAR